MSSGVKRSCTSQWPFQAMISTAVCAAILRARYSSGIMMTSRDAERLDDLLGVARGAADVGLGFHRGRGVDVGHDRHAGWCSRISRTSAAVIDASITAADIRLLRERHPGVPIVTYVNTSAAVKAESNVRCTSSNARKIIEGLGVPRVIMLPDEYLARNTAAQTKVEIIAWKGHCEVHERFTPEDIRSLRESHPGIIVLAHPECPPEVIAECDFSGSTAAMADYVGKERPARVVLLTECSMSDNVALQYPDLEFVRPCNLCPHMKRITLPKIRHSLETMTHEVTVDPAIAEGARRAVERMLAMG